DDRERRPHLRVRVPRGELRNDRHPPRRPRGGESEMRSDYKCCTRRGLLWLTESSSGGRTSVVPAVCVLVMSRANVGWNRACVTASNPDASLISVGSLNAVPMKLMPTGMPSTSPDGTWMIG